MRLDKCGSGQRWGAHENSRGGPAYFCISVSRFRGIHSRIFAYICLHLCILVCISVYMHMLMYICVLLCICIAISSHCLCIFECIRVCLHIFAYIHLYLHVCARIAGPGQRLASRGHQEDCLRLRRILQRGPLAEAREVHAAPHWLVFRAYCC